MNEETWLWMINISEDHYSSHQQHHANKYEDGDILYTFQKHKK